MSNFNGLSAFLRRFRRVSGQCHRSRLRSHAADVSVQCVEAIEPRVLLAAPAIADQAFNIAENSKIGNVVGSVVASDSDVGQSLTFEIVAGDSSAAFRIDSNSGELTVRRPVAIDFETTPQFLLTVRVTDDGAPSESAEATITVDIDDVEEGEIFGTYQAYVGHDLVFNVGALFGPYIGVPGIYEFSEAGLFDEFGRKEVFHGDFNGDGLGDVAVRDMLFPNQGIFHVGLNNGSSLDFTVWGTKWRSFDKADIYVGDFNGDGMDDIVAKRNNANSWRVGLSTGSAFDGQSLCRDLKNGTADDSVTKIGDFNGDGQADRAVFDANLNHWYVAYDTSRGWERWGSFYPNAKTWENWTVGDFDGNGFDDIAVKGSNEGKYLGHWRVEYSDATGGITEAKAISFVNRNYSGISHVGDFDGDGIDELMTGPFVVGQERQLYDLADFDAPNERVAYEQNWGGFPGSTLVNRVFVGDINADGLDDLIGMRPNGGRLMWARSDGLRFKFSELISDFPVVPGNVWSLQFGNYFDES